MLAGPGIETTLKLPETAGAAAYRFMITRLPGDGTNPAGSYDPTIGSPLYGTFLHLKCVLPSCGTNLLNDTTGTQIPPVLEWDPDGVEVFPPDCVQASLLGGLGLYSVIVERVPLPHDGYTVRTRRLLRYLAGGAGVIVPVPSGHSGIGSLNSSAVIRDVDDAVDLQLSSAWTYPILAGTNIATPAAAPNPVLIWTEFKA